MLATVDEPGTVVSNCFTEIVDVVANIADDFSRLANGVEESIEGAVVGTAPSINLSPDSCRVIGVI